MVLMDTEEYWNAWRTKRNNICGRLCKASVIYFKFKQEKKMELIYIFEGKFKQGNPGQHMVKHAANLYCQEKGLDCKIETFDIIRTAKGKPYFDGAPIEFSLTHSGKLWMCMFSQNPCGLDLQIVKDCSFKSIAKRYYTPNENSYVEATGLNGFFDIWVRKEAFCKMTGQGLFTDMPDMVNKDGMLLQKMNWCGRIYNMKEIFVSDDLKCAYCSENEIDIEMRLLG